MFRNSAQTSNMIHWSRQALDCLLQKFGTHLSSESVEKVDKVGFDTLYQTDYSYYFVCFDF